MFKLITSILIVFFFTSCEFFLIKSKLPNNKENIEKTVYGYLFNRYYLINSEIYLNSNENQTFLKISDENGSFEISQYIFEDLNQTEVFLTAKNGIEFSYNEENNITLKTVFFIQDMQKVDNFEINFSPMTTLFVDFYSQSEDSFQDSLEQFNSIFSVDFSIFENSLTSSNANELLTLNFQLYSIIDIFRKQLFVDSNLTITEQNDQFLEDFAIKISHIDSNMTSFTEVVQFYVDEKIEELNNSNTELNSEILNEVAEKTSSIEDDINSITDLFETNSSFESIINSIADAIQEQENSEIIVIENENNDTVIYSPTDFRTEIDSFYSIDTKYVNYSLEFILRKLDFLELNNSVFSQPIKFNFNSKSFENIDNKDDLEFFYIFKSDEFKNLNELFFENNKNYLSVYESNNFENSIPLFNIEISSIYTFGNSYFFNELGTNITIYNSSTSPQKEFKLTFKAKQNLSIASEIVAQASDYDNLNDFLYTNNLTNNENYFFKIKNNNIWKIEYISQNEIFFNKIFFNENFLYSFKIFLLSNFSSVDVIATH